MTVFEAIKTHPGTGEILEVRELPDIEIISAYKSHMRQRFNESHGKQGMWLRGSDGCRVPRPFVDYLKNLEDGDPEGAKSFFDVLQTGLKALEEAGGREAVIEFLRSQKEK